MFTRLGSSSKRRIWMTSNRWFPPDLSLPRSPQASRVQIWKIYFPLSQPSSVFTLRHWTWSESIKKIEESMKTKTILNVCLYYLDILQTVNGPSAIPFYTYIKMIDLIWRQFFFSGSRSSLRHWKWIPFDRCLVVVYMSGGRTSSKSPCIFMKYYLIERRCTNLTLRALSFKFPATVEVLAVRMWLCNMQVHSLHCSISSSLRWWQIVPRRPILLIGVLTCALGTDTFLLFVLDLIFASKLHRKCMVHIKFLYHAIIIHCNINSAHVLSIFVLARR